MVDESICWWVICGGVMAVVVVDGMSCSATRSTAK